MFVTTLFDFLVCGFHRCCYLSNFIFDSLLAWIYFSNSSSSSSNLSIFTLVFDFAIADSNLSKFLHYYSCALCDMVTFHAIGHSDLTIMVDESGMTIVFEHCLCVMFVFQLCSLHIFKDVSYDFNNIVSNSLYCILWPPQKGNNGWLVVVIITLLMIAWLIIIRKPFWQ